MIGLRFARGEVPEWPKGAGCKPVDSGLRWFESISLHSATLSEAMNTGFRRAFVRIVAFRAGVAQWLEH